MGLKRNSSKRSASGTVADVLVARTRLGGGSADTLWRGLLLVTGAANATDDSGMTDQGGTAVCQKK